MCIESVCFSHGIKVFSVRFTGMFYGLIASTWIATKKEKEKFNNSKDFETTCYISCLKKWNNWEMIPTVSNHGANKLTISSIESNSYKEIKFNFQIWNSQTILDGTFRRKKKRSRWWESVLDLWQWETFCPRISWCWISNFNQNLSTIVLKDVTTKVQPFAETLQNKTANSLTTNNYFEWT